jgi:hypothetical protein
MSELPELHTSERRSFKHCWQQWYWAYRMGLKPKGETPDALWFGIGVHYALAEWYRKGKKRGPHPADTFEQYCSDELREIKASLPTNREWYDEPRYEDARTLGTAMLVAYVDLYQNDPDWYVIAVEQPFRVNLMRDGTPEAIFASTFDGVYRDEGDGEIYLMEHKTAAQIMTSYLVLDDQAGAYWAVASQVLRSQGVLKSKEEIAGITYNFLRKSMPDDRPKDAQGNSLNQDGSVSKRQPAAAFVREIITRNSREQATQLDRIAQEAALMNMVRSGELPVIKNPSRDCTWCTFFDMCKLHEMGGSAWLEYAEATFIQENPYEREPIKSASE